MPKSNGAAVAALVIGILVVLLGGGAGIAGGGALSGLWVLFLAGLVMSIIALALSGRGRLGMSLIGLFLNIGGLVLGISVAVAQYTATH